MALLSRRRCGRRYDDHLQRPAPCPYDYPWARGDDYPKDWGVGAAEVAAREDRYRRRYTPAPRNRLREARTAAGMTQVQLAEVSGVAGRTIYSAERGAAPQRHLQRKLLLALGLSYADRHRIFPTP